MDRRELVEKMCNDYWNGRYETGCWSKAAEEPKLDIRKGMDAALSVAVEELLGEANALEYDAAIDATRTDAPQYSPSGHLHAYQVVRNFLASRRAQLERVKTPTELIEEYVTKHQVTSPLVSRFQIASEILALLEKK